MLTALVIFLTFATAAHCLRHHKESITQSWQAYTKVHKGKNRSTKY